MYQKLWKVFAITFLAAATCSFSAALKRYDAAQEDAQEKTEHLTFTEKYGAKSENPQMTEIPMASGYSESARINTKGEWDFNIFGSFIYWEALEDNLAVSCLRDTHNATAVLSYTNMDYDFKPGFKVGLGMNMGNHDNWVLNAEYLYLRGNYSKSSSIPDIWFYDFDPGFLSHDIVSGYSFLSGDGKWKNRLDLVDLTLGRPYYSGEKLTLSPAFGLRGGWMGQRYHATYTATVSADTTFHYEFSSRSRQKTWLIGPRAVLFADWNLGQGFRIFTDIAAGLYYQHFHNRFTDKISGIAYSTTAEKTETITPNYELGLGLGYGDYYFSKKLHVDLTVGYDFQVFMNQNRMKILVNNLSEVSSQIFLEAASPANLVLHGLTVNLRFDF